MNLVKCPQCGELYSPSYPRCPFCEEDGEIDSKGKSKPKRRIGGQRAGQSARGGLIVVLVLVLALLSWYLFRGNIIRRGKDTAATPDSTQSQTETTEPEGPSVPAINPTDTVKADGTDGTPEKSDGENTTDGSKSGESNDTTTVPAVEPSLQENVDVSKAQLNKSDFTLSFAGEKYTIKLSGTDAKPTWSIDNANVATLSSDGTVTAVANGNTTVHCKVGDRDLTCTVRVRNTGKNAAAADTPTTATSVQPEAPAQPNTSSTTSGSAATPPVPVNSSGNNAEITGAKLNREDFTLPKVGDKFTMKLTGTTAEPSWTVDNPNVATISSDGTVTAVGSGNTKIHCKVGSMDLTCIVRVP
ncbi:MAG: Ig-like domain-containing protein [Oscillospiraceae bacterium]|nr:Ig-like domain-containing protein [Oscillospiraceae bacterium]